MKNLLQGYMNDAMVLLIGALLLVAIVFVIMTWMRTRSLVPTLGSALAGVIIIALVASFANLKTGAQNDITRYTGTTNVTLPGQG